MVNYEVFYTEECAKDIIHGFYWYKNNINHITHYCCEIVNNGHKSIFTISQSNNEYIKFSINDIFYRHMLLVETTDAVIISFSDGTNIYTYINVINSKGNRTEVICYECNKYAIAIGRIGDHAFVITPTFTYDSNNCAAPMLLPNDCYSFIFPIEGNITQSILETQLKKLYNEFCDNLYS